MRTAIGAFEAPEAGPTIDELVDAGFANLSVVAREDSDGPAPAFADLAGRIEGLHPITMTDVGPVVAAGPFAELLDGHRALESLVGAGLPDVTAEGYIETLRHGGTLICADVPDERIDDAIAIMGRHSRASRQSGEAPAPLSALDDDDAPELVTVRTEVIIEDVVANDQIDGHTYEAPPDAAAPDAEADERAFRSHHEAQHADAGASFEAYEPAYRYGRDLGQSHPGREWAAVEPEAQRHWETRQPGTWGRFVAAVKHAWERATGRP